MARIAVIGLVGRSMFFDVPHFHSGGETIHAERFHEEWGGKGFNQAGAAALIRQSIRIGDEKPDARPLIRGVVE